MPGYLIAINNSELDSRQNELWEKVEAFSSKGVYATRVVKSNWYREKVLADFVSMQEGDNIYFFTKRTIFGVWKVKKIMDNFVYNNYPSSNISEIKDNTMISLLGEDRYQHYPWFCTFEANPGFFKLGVDMDDVLSYKPSAFTQLRVFERLSFIKLSNEENDALKEIIMLKNNKNGIRPKTDYDFKLHRRIEKMSFLDSYKLNLDVFLLSVRNKERFRHETALEIAVIDMIKKNQHPLFHLDDGYSMRQVPASPIKPSSYIDKIDVLAIDYLPINGTKVPKKYRIYELKKDEATVESVDQIMKYVDYMAREKTFNDYDFIEAIIIAGHIPEEVITYVKRNSIRYFMEGSHPAITRKWNNIHLAEYRITDKKIVFEELSLD